MRLKSEWLKKKRNVLFLDLGGVLREGMVFSVDGVHLNKLGCKRMGSYFCVDVCEVCGEQTA